MTTLMHSSPIRSPDSSFQEFLEFLRARSEIIESGRALEEGCLFVTIVHCGTKGRKVDVAVAVVAGVEIVVAVTDDVGEAPGQGSRCN